MDRAALLIDRIKRLDRLIEVYGDVLIALELRRPPESVVPVLVETGRYTTPDIEVLLREILEGGGARLVAELEGIEVDASLAADPEVSKAVEQVRDAIKHTARHYADALLWSLGLFSGEGGSPLKRGQGLDVVWSDARAFVTAVARLQPPAPPASP